MGILAYWLELLGSHTFATDPAGLPQHVCNVHILLYGERNVLIGTHNGSPSTGDVSSLAPKYAPCDPEQEGAPSDGDCHTQLGKNSRSQLFAAILAADDIPNLLGGHRADAVGLQQVVLACGHHGFDRPELFQ